MHAQSMHTLRRLSSAGQERVQSNDFKPTTCSDSSAAPQPARSGGSNGHFIGLAGALGRRKGTDGTTNRERLDGNAARRKFRTYGYIWDHELAGFALRHFGEARFCPTGGITFATAREWLALDAVLCVGGSWVAPKGVPDPEQIETLARAASELGG